MGVFDGGAYRIRSRMEHDINGHKFETRAERFEEDEESAREVVEDWRAYGVDAVDVRYVHFVYSDHDPGLSFGDYYGDGEDE
ncbi:hypothetical protein ACWGHU_03210 [Streptomyces xanthophaeus]